MKLVTDPNVLSQLEGSAAPKMGTPVSDPAILAQLNGTPPPKSSEPEMVDTFLGKMPKNPKDATMFGLPMFPDYNNKEQMAKVDQALKERRLGALQSLANYPIDIYNLFAKNPANKFDFAPHTDQAKLGGVVGDVGSFFMPGGAGKALLKGATYLPKVGKGVNAILKAVEASPWLKGAASVGRTAGESALYNAAHNPDDAGEAALTGAGFGGGTQLAANLVTSRNPLLNLLARMGVGAGLGTAVGHPYYGAVAGAGFPEVTKMLGLSGKNAIAQDVLEGLSPRDIARAKAANDRLGTTITPAQASGNYITAATEGSYKRSPQGAQFAYRNEQLQNRQQSKAINKMLDSIYKPTPQSEANINALYQKAEQMNVNPAVISQMKTNPIVENAFKTVKSDPAFSQVPENNYRYLAEVDRQLYRDYQAARRNQPNSAYQIKNTKNSFNNFLTQANPDYEAATKAAKPKIVRRNIEERFNRNEEDFTGKNFYNKFLNLRKPYQDILRETANFPQAQQAIKDMRAGWKHLSNIKTVSQGESQSKAALDQTRNTWKAIMDATKRLVNAKGDMKGLKFIYSPDWDKEFARIMQAQDKNERNRQLLTLMGKVALANGLDPNE